MYDAPNICGAQVSIETRAQVRSRDLEPPATRLHPSGIAPDLRVFMTRSRSHACAGHEYHEKATLAMTSQRINPTDG